MKSFSRYSVFILLGIFTLSVSSCTKNGCSRSDWVGIYEKEMVSCSVDPFFDEEFTLNAGPCSSCVNFDAANVVEIDEDCSLRQESKVYGDIIMTLEGDVLNVSVPQLNCTAMYRRK